uniref:Glycosyltransferase 2-like domain-containing protein n=1 Tax=Periophthalmus magnuspinnatus TaxID=409849 RepID=A0A3B4AXN7_9GOBI
MYQHRRESCSGPQSAVHLHLKATNDSFEDGEVQILAREKKLFDRGVKEAIFVRKDNPSLNRNGEKKEPGEKKPTKLFPQSPLFKEWGVNLSEEEQKEAQALFELYGYNVFLSDRLPLDRGLPDTREKGCLTKTYPKDLPSIGVVLIYLNEALSILKRAIRSIVNRTPKHLLKEIIMVDDNSSNGGFITKTQHLKCTRLGRIVSVRGLAFARASGWRAATADVVAILDAHIEVHELWAEPLLTQIKKDRTVIASPVFDRVNFDDLKVIQYLPASHAFDWALWCMYESFTPEYYELKDSSLPGKSPSVMGIFVADRQFLGEIGVLDEGMKVYGGENVELGIRVSNIINKISLKFVCFFLLQSLTAYCPLSWSISLTPPICMQAYVRQCSGLWLDKEMDWN